ncbi:HPP family protein [Streptosporangium sp. DT93]|uniref:HPP family protein n=1 Tax=Streptosporangium sp. DT93 TaxID=3393428 RepID=UPI003CEC7694
MTSVPVAVPPLSPSFSPPDPEPGTAGESTVTYVRRVLRGRAPDRPRSAAIVVLTAGATVSLVTLVAFGAVLGQVWLMPPLVASAALVFGAPALPLAQPRSVIGGQFLAALTGFAVLALAGSSTWAAAVAGGLALGVTALTRTPHSPAAATATIVVAQHPPMLPFLAILVAATVVLVIVGILVGRSGVTPRYPAYWW